MTNLTHEQRNNLKLSVGSHSRERPLTPIEVANLLRDQGPKQLEELAKEIGLADSSILKQLVSLLYLPPDSHQHIVWGAQKNKMSFSVAAEIARLKDSGAAREMFDLAMDKKLSKLSVRQILQRSRNCQTSPLQSYLALQNKTS